MIYHADWSVDLQEETMCSRAAISTQIEVLKIAGEEAAGFSLDVELSP